MYVILYSLTAPAVIPLVRYFLTKIAKIITGVEITTAAAAINPYSVSSNLIKLLIITGTVFVLALVTIRA